MSVVFHPHRRMIVMLNGLVHVMLNGLVYVMLNGLVYVMLNLIQHLSKEIAGQSPQ